MQTVAARTADVDDVVGMIEMDGGGAHRLGAGGDLVDRLAAQANGRDGGGHLGRRRLTAQAGGKELFGVFGVERRAVGQLGQQRFEGVEHRAFCDPAPARSRKLARS